MQYGMLCAMLCSLSLAVATGSNQGWDDSVPNALRDTSLREHFSKLLFAKFQATAFGATSEQIWAEESPGKDLVQQGSCVRRHLLSHKFSQGNKLLVLAGRTLYKRMFNSGLADLDPAGAVRGRGGGGGGRGGRGCSGHTLQTGREHHLL